MPHFKDCFNGVHPMPGLCTEDFKVIKHSVIPGGHRFFTTYRAEKNGRYKYRKDIAAALEQTLTGKQWQWHHVLEGYHLPRLFAPKDAEKLYDDFIPCVLLDTKEHDDYDVLLHGDGSDMVSHLPPMKGPVLTGQERAVYKQKLLTLYTGAYGHDHVLSTVLRNTLALL